jgi:hypothetical protein
LGIVCDYMDGDAAVDLSEDIHFATDYTYDIVSGNSRSSQVNILPYVIYGQDTYEDFSIYTSWNFENYIASNQLVYIKLYSRSYIEEHKFRWWPPLSEYSEDWEETPLNLIQWTSSYDSTPAISTWNFSKGETEYKMPYGKDISTNPSVSTYGTQSAVSGWRYMGYYRCNTHGNYDALLKLRVNNELAEDYATSGVSEIIDPYLYTYRILQMEFKVEFEFQSYVYIYPSGWQWYTMSTHTYTFGVGGTYDVSEITIESGESTDS